MLTKRRDEAPEAGVPEGRGANVSVIGKGLRVLGDCESDGEVRVEGSVMGSVRAHRVHVAETGTVQGDVMPNEGSGGDEVFTVGGRVGGAVRGAEVEVRRGGTIEGPVNAERAVIRGKVGGGIVVKDRLAIEETAIVSGDIQARRLAIKEGGQFDGRIKMTEQAPREKAPAPSSAPALATATPT